MDKEILSDLAPEKYDVTEVTGRMGEIGPADGAAAMEFLPVIIAAQTAQRLTPKAAAEIFSRMEDSRAAEVIKAMSPESAAQIVSAMAPDDRVDLLEILPRDLHDGLLGRLTAQTAAETRALEQFPPDTAGGIMTTQFTALPQDLTVQQAIENLRSFHEQAGQMFYVYVVDQLQRLMGVLSMRKLIMAPADTPLKDIMIPNVSSVPATMDQEEVARLMRTARYLALPVVDKDRRLVGLITYDDVVDVIQEEATEDVQRMFGAGAEERLSSPWRFSFSKRIWWLQVNLATAFMAGAVVSLFNATIARFAVLAIYIPIVSGMGSNAAAQAMSVSIRGIALGRTDRKLLRHVLIRESIVGLLTGIVAGTTAALIALVWQQSTGVVFGVVVAASLVLTQTIACVSGASIPFVMKRLGFDPAQSATIFATTITDIVGFATLLGFAKLCESWMTR